MRLREDRWWDAGTKRAAQLGGAPDPRVDPHKNWDPLYIHMLDDDSFESAQEGDVWEIRRSPTDGRVTSYVGKDHEGWVMVGYALWCPNESCEYGVHLWTHMPDCDARFGGPCKNRKPEGHIQSCWFWAGSISDSSLTASPALDASAQVGCGWSGHLRSGELVEQP